MFCLAPPTADHQGPLLLKVQAQCAAQRSVMAQV